ncbi:ankyrin repeat and SOCS box protein 2-like [Asterias rubens]|uniref:ankyrin repeat and SOCS box protein 2-like n=1 Tax=Asterias rubens TaxID=7604 RepID=UPI001455681B|nr:ankyrin repeat and SOCS box protein 2-like [Asterias rubens]
MMYRRQIHEALLIAVEQGDLPNVQLAVKRGADINEIPWGMESVLMRAIRCRHSDVAEFLIEQGVDLGYHYEKTSSPRERKPHETARDYAEFYKLPDIVQLIDTKRAYRR